MRNFSRSLVAAAFLSALAGEASAATWQGASAGSWGMPVNAVGVETLTSVNGGTNNHFEWGTPAPDSFTNYVEYNGVDFTALDQAAFAVGEIEYRNGAVFNSFNGDFPLTITLTLTSPLNNVESFEFNFNIINTPNTTGDPVLDGDHLAFSAFGVANETFEYEGETFTLYLRGFSIDGGQTIISEFNSPEGATAEARLYAQIIRPQDIPEVPEPATLALLGAGGMALAARRRG